MAKKKICWSRCWSLFLINLNCDKRKYKQVTKGQIYFFSAESTEIGIFFVLFDSGPNTHFSAMFVFCCCWCLVTYGSSFRHQPTVWPTHRNLSTVAQNMAQHRDCVTQKEHSQSGRLCKKTYRLETPKLAYHIWFITSSILSMRPFSVLECTSGEKVVVQANIIQSLAENLQFLLWIVRGYAAAGGGRLC